MNLDYLVIHCTATQDGRPVTKEELEMWHKAPREISGGRLKYLGKIYQNEDELPNEKINGRLIKNIRGRGWDRFGYSDIIHLSGTLENLTPFNLDNKVDPWEITWGASGMNSRSRHVVYVGGLSETTIDDHWEPTDTRNAEQLMSMEIYIRYMILRHPNIRVAGHNQFSSKACPCFDVADWCRSIGISEKNIHNE